MEGKYVERWKKLYEGLLPDYISIPIADKPVTLSRNQYVTLAGLGLLCLIGIGLAINRYMMKRIARSELNFEIEE